MIKSPYLLFIQKKAVGRNTTDKGAPFAIWQPPGPLPFPVIVIYIMPAA
jgi:hypothetical protein